MCMDCQAVSCVDCKDFGDHQGHKHQLITAVAEGQRNQLREAVTAAEAVEAAAAGVARAVEAVVDEIGAASGCCSASEGGGGGTLNAAEQQIAGAFGKARAALDTREQELTAMVRALADEKMAKADEQLHELCMLRSKLHAAAECAEATIAMAPSEVSARFKLCLDTLQAATDAKMAAEPTVDSRIPVNLPLDTLLHTIAGFGSAGGPGMVQGMQYVLQGATVSVTWQPPDAAALPVVAYRVERAVGAQAQNVAAGRTERLQFEQQVDDLAGQSVTYRVQAEDAGGNVGPWCEGSAIQLPETFLAFTECGSNVTIAGSVATKTGSKGRVNSVAVIGGSLTAGVHCWEVELTSGGNYIMVGVCRAGVDIANTNDLYTSNDAWFMYMYNGGLFGNGKSSADAAGAFATGDRLGMRLDLNAGTLSFFKNGSPHGPGHTGVAGPVKRCVEMYGADSSVTVLPNVSFLWLVELRTNGWFLI